MPPSIFYLHGLGSFPSGQKASDLRRRFAARGIELRVPDLNVPDFEHLTMTAMLARIAAEVRACPPGPVYLIGSSLGGSAALHFTDRYREAEGARVERLLLLAPAFDFQANRMRQLGDEGLRRWREQGWLPFFHFGLERECRLHYGLYEDMLGYDSYAVTLDLPIRIIHGARDVNVDAEQSVRFAHDRPNVDLRLVDSDHGLFDQIDVIWETTLDFFGV